LLAEDGSQRLLWFSPVPGTDAVEKLELLSVLGTQDLAAEAGADAGHAGQKR